MFRTASRFSVMLLSVFCLLAFVEPAAAQKTKSRASKAKSSRVTSSRSTNRAASAVRSRGVVRGSAARSQARPSSVKTLPRTRVNVAPQGKDTRRASPTVVKPRVEAYRSRGATTVKPRVNVSGQDRAAQVRSRVRTVPQGTGARGTNGSGIGAAKQSQRTSSRAELDARVRTQRGSSASSSFRDPSDISGVKRAITGGRSAGPESSFRSRTEGDRISLSYASRFRERPSARAWASARSRYDRLHRTYTRSHPGYTYWHGFWDGYTYGYHRGYHVGFHGPYGYHHHRLHRHYYGTHLVLGYHFGGFGFYHNYWHFVIVIGAPLVVYESPWYGYTWWDGYGASLVTWDRATQVYSENYVFGDGSCVELHIATTDGATYAIKIDPRYYDAQDPGDLYAQLWSELATQGELRLQDLNGAVHIFQAGMIQQIEARACR